MIVHILDSLSEINRFVDEVGIPSGKILAFDLETDSIEEKLAKIMGVGFAFDEEQAFYIPIRTTDKSLFFPTSTEFVVNFIKAILDKNKVIGHNIIYDTLVWKNNYNHDISSKIVADTILMKHCLDEEPPFGLKEIAVSILGEWADKAQTAMIENIKSKGGSTTKTNFEMWKCDTNILGEYCGWDVLLTYKLYNKFKNQIEQENLIELFETEVMPVYREVTIPMKEKGIPIDLDYFRNLQTNITIEIDKLEELVMSQIESLVEQFQLEILNTKCEIKKTGNFPKALAKVLGLEVTSLAKKNIENLTTNTKAQADFKAWLLTDVHYSIILNPEDVLKTQLTMFFDKHPDQNFVFNLRSKDNLKYLFFDILKEEPLSHTDGGAPQVDDEFLKSIKTKYVWVKDLQDLNKLEKIKGTYIEGILERQIDGHIYASLLQFGTTSGRYASRNPNLQNLPRPKEDDSGLSELVLKYTNAIRAGFVAPKGYKFVDADYSALEPRCLWEYTNINTTQGITYLKDIKVGDYVSTVHGFRQVTNKWQSNKKALDILTNYGMLKVSEDHKIFSLTRCAWIKASELQVGENLQVKVPEKIIGKEQNLPVFLAANFHANKSPIGYLKLTAEIAWGLGAFLGDGLSCFKPAKSKGHKCNSFGYTGYVGICGMQEDGVVNKFEQIFNQYGLGFSSWKDKRTTSGTMLQSISSGAHSLNLFSSTFQVAQPKDSSKKFGSKNMRVPHFILNAPTDVRVAFLAGIIDTDGTVGTKSNTSHDATIYTAVPEFANDLVRLVESLGLYARITYTIKDKKHFGCQVRLPKNSLAKLNLDYNLTSFMICKRKADKIKQTTEAVVVHTPCEIKHIIPNQNVTMYDIEVEGEHEFLAENHRVHNCFAHMSGDKNLQAVFHSGEDMYSAIAKRVFKLEDVGTFKKDPNFLGKLYPEKRQIIKALALAVTYGAEAYRIADLLGVDKDTAQQLIDDYLTAYPGLKDYIKTCHYEANNRGEVRTIFGRVRHLKKANEIYKSYGHSILDSRWAKSKGLSEVRREYKNKLNNSTNFKIQGLAAHIVNRAMLNINRKFKENNIDGWVCLQIHDQIVCTVKESQAEKAKVIVQECMENVAKLSVPLVAEPKIAENLKDSH